MPDTPALLTEPQKTEIRRHLGYPEPSTGLNVGGPPYFQDFGQSGAHIGDRYTPAFYDFEYRLISLSQTANVAVLGGESAYFSQSLVPASALITAAFTGSSATADETLTVVLAGTPVTITLLSGDTIAAIVTRLAAALAPAISSLAVVGSTATAVQLRALTPGPIGNAIPVYAIGSLSVTLTVTDTNAQPASSLRGGTEPPGPRYVDPATGLTIYGHLPIIRFWETGIANAADGMDTLKVGDFTQNPAEYAKRRHAYYEACKDMAQTLAVVFYGAKSYRGAQGLRRTY